MQPAAWFLKLISINEQVLVSVPAAQIDHYILN